MAYPSRLSDVDDRPIGSIIHKAGVTLVQVAVRAIAKTTGSDPVGWMAVATHVDGEDATHSDSGTREVVTIAAVNALGKAKAVSSSDPLPVTSTTAALTYTGNTVHVAGLTETTIAPVANQKRIRLKVHHASATLYYGFATGVTTSNGFPIEAGGLEELDYSGTLYLISDTASTNVPHWRAA